MIIDLHTHTLLSDGGLILAEHLRRAECQGYNYIAITDHVDSSSIESVLSKTVKGCSNFNKYSTTLVALPGVEITHVNPKEIMELVIFARNNGALIVGVHGETIVEPVHPGTNLEAIKSKVDFLAHPGILSEEEAELAANNNVFLEVTSRQGHSLGNGRVVNLARKYSAPIAINSDSHSHYDFYTENKYLQTALGAGLLKEEFEEIKNNLKKFVSTKI